MTPAANRSPQRKRVLIASISPGSGGVDTMTGFIVGLLVRHGYEPVIAHYETYSSSPHMSVPSFRLLQRTVTAESRTAYGQCEAHAIGAWLPELEFTHYLASSHWRQIMDSCEAFVMVSGNILAATPFWQTNRPYLAWVATDWEGDRKDRVKHFSWPRKWLDKAINGPVIRRLEKTLLKSGNVLALSEYTARTLVEITGSHLLPEVLPMPVGSELFSMRPEATVPRRIGFTGRFDDPRKNIGLLLAAMAELKQTGESVTALLIAGQPTAEILQQVSQLGLSEQTVFLPRLSRLELATQLQTFDVFVLPSHQEGLCISALEAMSCGIPVVSTRCGGPEEFVITGQTGILVHADPHEMAHAIQSIVNDRALRARLSAGARRMIESRYTLQHAERIFMNAFNSSFPHLQKTELIT